MTITKHVILDLETLSVEPNAAILQIGAVASNSNGIKVAEFEATIGQTNAFLGAKAFSRHISVDTMQWWDEQLASTKQLVLNRATQPDYETAMRAFINWFKDLGDKKDIAVWGRGPDFDNVILASSIKSVGLELPWYYPNNRCLRTLMDIVDINPRDCARLENEIEHTALGDARFESRLFKFAKIRLTIGVNL